eukprot:CAMPEP_0173337032 /NCGR_PEP_ID=MMETSP1144-20121109/6907_1 /TAXON_ID=483371 /ORGANISM="non described non described, Strain CCMP2298" /LENGTH=160 /DNA_ID=CAMNT_0014282431 /DNA_START=1159 /DNA_END=1641 /DNA_ORIENTATION=-
MDCMSASSSAPSLKSKPFTEVLFFASNCDGLSTASETIPGMSIVSRIVQTSLFATTTPQPLPKYEDTPRKLGRAAVIGFCASAISDTCSNSIRVLKVYKQANTTKISYGDALKAVIKEDGVAGLFGRGLQTKIIANGMQGLMFSVLWKLIDEKMFPKEKK